MPRVLRTAIALVALAAALVLWSAAPAGADPAEPGPYRSEVTSGTIADGAVELYVTGGDSFLTMEVEPGHEVVVFGYDGEPYVRVLEDGTVQENERSPAVYQNEDRYGAPVPDEADADAEPKWVDVGDGGTYSWHDHRIHWMSPDAPPRLEGGTGLVQEWVVDLEVDGEPAEVTGRLDRVSGVGPLPWLGLALAVGLGAWLVGRARVATVLPVLATVGGVVALYVAWRELAAQPAGTGASPVATVLGAVALALALAAGGLHLARRQVAADVAGLGSAAALGGWVLLRFSVLAEPVLPTDLPPNLDKAGTAIVFGLAVAIAVLGVQGASLGATGEPAEGPGDGDRGDGHAGEEGGEPTVGSGPAAEPA